MKKTLLTAAILICWTPAVFAGGLQIAHCTILDEKGNPTAGKVDLFQEMPQGNNPQVTDYVAVMTYPPQKGSTSSVGNEGLLGPVSAPIIAGSTATTLTIDQSATNPQTDLQVSVVKGTGTVGHIVAGASLTLKCDATW